MSEHPVVACYSGLDSADAVQVGGQLAAALKQPLVLAQAYEYEPVSLSARVGPAPANRRRAGAAQAALRRARAFTGSANIEIREQIVPSAGVADALVDLARDVDACLLVVGRDTDGHVTRQLLPRAPCPVVVAPLSVALPPPGPFARIGVAVDGSPPAQMALVAATALARACDARLVLLAVGTSEHAAAWLHVARLSPGRDIEIESRALTGNAGEALAAASRELDLLACGSRGRSRPVAALLGSVSTHLAAHAECPLLVVPPGSQPSGVTARHGRAA